MLRGKGLPALSEADTRPGKSCLLALKTNETGKGSVRRVRFWRGGVSVLGLLSHGTRPFLRTRKGHDISCPYNFGRCGLAHGKVRTGTGLGNGLRGIISSRFAVK